MRAWSNRNAACIRKQNMGGGMQRQGGTHMGHAMGGGGGGVGPDGLAMPAVHTGIIRMRGLPFSATKQDVIKFFQGGWALRRCCFLLQDLDCLTRLYLGVDLLALWSTAVFSFCSPPRSKCTKYDLWGVPYRRRHCCPPPKTCGLFNVHLTSHLARNILRKEIEVCFPSSTINYRK